MNVIDLIFNLLKKEKFIASHCLLFGCFLFFFGSFSMQTHASSIPLEELIGQFDEKNDPRFVELNQFGFETNKPNMYLQKEAAEKLFQAYQDFKKLHPQIPFVIVSATRNYDYQKGIWTRKWTNLHAQFNDKFKTAKNILEYSAMPGTSRHHWGTDVDITALNSNYFIYDPQGKILYEWLIENMNKYGFCQPYTADRNTGYKKEEWHWSYHPLSVQYLKQYQVQFKKSPDDIINYLDFMGYEELPLKAFIQEYVFSVNPNCF